MGIGSLPGQWQDQQFGLLVSKRWPELNGHQREGWVMVMEAGLVLVVGDQEIWVFLSHLCVWVCVHVCTARTSLFLFGRSVSNVYFARAGQAPVSTLLTKKQLAVFLVFGFFWGVGAGSAFPNQHMALPLPLQKGRTCSRAIFTKSHSCGATLPACPDLVGLDVTQQHGQCMTAVQGKENPTLGDGDQLAKRFLLLWILQEKEQVRTGWI